MSYRDRWLQVKQAGDQESQCDGGRSDGKERFDIARSLDSQCRRCRIDCGRKGNSVHSSGLKVSC